MLSLAALVKLQMSADVRITSTARAGAFTIITALLFTDISSYGYETIRSEMPSERVPVSPVASRHMPHTHTPELN